MQRLLHSRILQGFATAILGSIGLILIVIASSGGSLVATEADCEFGTRSPNCALSHTFYLKNNTFHRVAITSITPSCSCDTDAKSARTELGWLDETQLTVNWRSPVKPGAAKTQVIVGYVADGKPGTVLVTMQWVVSPQQPAGITQSGVR